MIGRRFCYVVGGMVCSCFCLISVSMISSKYRNRIPEFKVGVWQFYHPQSSIKLVSQKAFGFYLGIFVLCLL